MQVEDLVIVLVQGATMWMIKMIPIQNAKDHYITNRSELMVIELNNKYLGKNILFYNI